MIILTLTLSYKWSFHKLDVNNAFINGLLDEEVCMQQPQGFEHSDKYIVYKLNKALYDLKQARWQWFLRMKATLVQLGFLGSKCDTSLFTYNN